MYSICNDPSDWGHCCTMNAQTQLWHLAKYYKLLRSMPKKSEVWLVRPMNFAMKTGYFSFHLKYRKILIFVFTYTYLSVVFLNLAIFVFCYAGVLVLIMFIFRQKKKQTFFLCLSVHYKRKSKNLFRHMHCITCCFLIMPICDTLKFSAERLSFILLIDISPVSFFNIIKRLRV